MMRSWACAILPAPRSSESTLGIRPAPLRTRSASTKRSAGALIDDTQAVAGRLDTLHLDTGVQRDADALAFAAEPADHILIQVLEQPWQCLEDNYLGTRARIDMAELERNHAAADEHHGARQLAIAQHLVRGDRVLGALHRQLARLGTGRDHDMLGLDRRPPDAHFVGTEGGMPPDDLHATFGERARDRLGNGADQLLFALN